MRIIFVGYMIILHAGLILLLADKFLVVRETAKVDEGLVKDLAPGPQVTPVVLPTELPTPVPEPSTGATPPPLSAGTGGLIIPVQGSAVRPDGYLHGRPAEGRFHDAIDIIAPAGTPVWLSLTARSLSSGQCSGRYYHLPDQPGQKIFFLLRSSSTPADGIAEKQPVRQGTVIGYVGDTGNATPGNYHLHFSITSVIDPTRYWEGTEINPYPVLNGMGSLP